MARTCQGWSKLRNVSRIRHCPFARSGFGPQSPPVPVVGKDAPVRQTVSLKANRSAPAILLVCPRETGTCDSGCSSAGGCGGADDVEWCFFASQEKRAMKLTLSSASERTYHLTFAAHSDYQRAEHFTGCLHHRHQ